LLDRGFKGIYAKKNTRKEKEREDGGINER
jgi:hypothetical protein